MSANAVHFRKGSFNMSSVQAKTYAVLLLQEIALSAQEHWPPPVYEEDTYGTGMHSIFNKLAPSVSPRGQSVPVKRAALRLMARAMRNDGIAHHPALYFQENEYDLQEFLLYIEKAIILGEEVLRKHAKTRETKHERTYNLWKGRRNGTIPHRITTVEGFDES